MSDIQEFIGCKSIETVTDDETLYNMWLTETPIVRCRDCMYLHFQKQGDLWCSMFTDMKAFCPKLNDFCAWGERNER